MNAPMRVLAVDDDARYLRLARVNLESAGHEFVGYTDPRAALDSVTAVRPDLVLLDVRMPALDGFAFLQQLREFSDVPVVFVSALGGEVDKVRGLRLGGDDYLVKPYSAPELLARVEAVLRRHRAAPASPVVRIGELRVDFAQRRVFRDDAEIALSRTEYRLLATLARQAGKVLPQDELVREVWGPFYEEGYEGLRVYVFRLRQKLEPSPEAPRYLKTVAGVGYMLDDGGAVTEP